MIIRELRPSDIPWAEDTVSEYFGSPRIVSRGVLHYVRDLPGFLAEEGSAPIGLVQYKLSAGQCEVVVLISTVQGQGIGRALLKRVTDQACEAGCTRVWLITTNDNQTAQEFYAALGWKQVAVHLGAMQESRKLKPEIPEFDKHGNPIEDEIEFELKLRVS
jgi:GNAT superfamily N-acetyltransferase